MAMFQFDTAFMIEAIAFAGGLVLIHFGRSGSALLLRVAGWVLVVAALGTAACSVYYAIRYHVQGEFDRAYGGGHADCLTMAGPRGSMMMHGPGPGMGAMHRFQMPVPPPSPGAEAAPPAAEAEPEEAPATE